MDFRHSFTVSQSLFRCWARDDRRKLAVRKLVRTRNAVALCAQMVASVGLKFGIIITVWRPANRHWAPFAETAKGVACERPRASGSSACASMSPLTGVPATKLTRLRQSPARSSSPFALASQRCIRCFQLLPKQLFETNARTCRTARPGLESASLGSIPGRVDSSAHTGFIILCRSLFHAPRLV